MSSGSGSRSKATPPPVLAFIWYARANQIGSTSCLHFCLCLKAPKALQVVGGMRCEKVAAFGRGFIAGGHAGLGLFISCLRLMCKYAKSDCIIMQMLRHNIRLMNYSDECRRGQGRVRAG